MKKISFIFGTRPEAIKLCPLILAMKKHKDFNPHICVTGQHREMLEQVLKVFDVVPDVDLDLMKTNQSLSSLTSSVISNVDSYLIETKPDMVLVQGDTTTTFAASLAAFYRDIPIGHIEAGLRTWNKHAPFPEEINRKQTSAVADLHFAPTEGAKQNLLNEGIPEEIIHVTGNTVIDALLYVVNRIKKDKDLEKTLSNQFPFLDSSKKLILVTGHRRESFGEGFERICQALKRLGKREDIQFVYPVHLNPNVQKPASI